MNTFWSLFEVWNSLNNLFLLNIFFVPLRFSVQTNTVSWRAKILEGKIKNTPHTHIPTPPHQKIRNKKWTLSSPGHSWTSWKLEILTISQGMKIYRLRRLNKQHPGSCLFGYLPKPRSEYNGRVHLPIFSSCLPKLNSAKLPLFLEICSFTPYLVKASMDRACKVRTTLWVVVADSVDILYKPFFTTFQFFHYTPPIPVAGARVQHHQHSHQQPQMKDPFL